MKNQVGFLYVLLALIFISIFAGSFLALKPVAEAQAELMLRDADPFDQLIEYRQAESGSTAVFWIVGILAIVMIGIGSYALLERYTKAARATKNLIKPARRARAVPAIQQVQPAQIAQIANQGSQQWEDSQMQQQE